MRILKFAVSVIQLLCLAFIAENAFAQSSSKAIKLSGIFSENKSNQVYPIANYNLHQFGITNFSPSVSLFKSNKNFTELGIQNFSINHSNQSVITYYDSTKIKYVNGTSTTHFNMQFYIEKNIRIFKKKEGWKLQPYIGFSVNPFVNYVRFIPLSSTNFPASIRNFGVDINIIPRLLYNINSKFFLDVNLPITMAQFSSYRIKTDNPNYSKSENTVGGFNFDMLFNKAACRVGLGYRI